MKWRNVSWIVLLFSAFAYPKAAFCEPPAEFFLLLSETQLEVGKIGYDKLRSMVPRMPFNVAVAKVKAGKAILGDARPLKSYMKGHVVGAIPLPWDRIDVMKVKLPKNVEIVLYCR